VCKPPKTYTPKNRCMAPSNIVLQPLHRFTSHIKFFLWVTQFDQLVIVPSKPLNTGYVDKQIQMAYYYTRCSLNNACFLDIYSYPIEISKKDNAHILFHDNPIIIIIRSIMHRHKKKSWAGMLYVRSSITTRLSNGWCLPIRNSGSPTWIYLLSTVHNTVPLKYYSLCPKLVVSTLSRYTCIYTLKHV
jgi:hypothetical protein